VQWFWKRADVVEVVLMSVADWDFGLQFQVGWE